MKYCWECDSEWEGRTQPGFREECASCMASLHCCKNCKFYEAEARQWCREPMARAERPRDPEGSNTCSYFLFRQDERLDTSERRKEARENLTALFEGSSLENNVNTAVPDPEDWQKFNKTTKSDLDAIFKPPDKE